MKNIIKLVVYLIAILMLLVGFGMCIYGLIHASFAFSHNVGLIVTGLLFSLIGYMLSETIENLN